jgi:hypothetical protein
MKKQSDHQEQPEDKPKKAAPAKPLKVLSTSLGLMLAGHLLLVPALPAVEAAAPSASSSTAAPANPKLVEWSSEDVKAYYNPVVDWSIPLPKLDSAANGGQPTPTPSPGTSGSGSTTIINNNNSGHSGGFGFGGGFGWDDLLLYHMIFNMGSPYSSSSWVGSRPSYDYRTNQPYTPPASTNRSFANQPAADMTTPRTNSRTGSFSTNKSSSGSVSSSQSSSSSSASSSKSTSTSSGSIGGTSSGFSSSSGG